MNPFYRFMLIAFLVAITMVIVISHPITRRRLVVLLLVSSILFPEIPIPGLFNLRFEELLGLVLIPFILPYLRGSSSAIDLAFAAMVIFTFISMLWGALALGSSISPRDFMEFVKLVKFWLFFRLAIYPWAKQDIKIIISWLVTALVISGLIGILQQGNWLGIGDLFVQIFSDSGEESGRIIGTTANPNDFALLIFTGFAFIASTLTWFRPRLKIIIVLGLQLFLIVMIFSRSGALGVSIVLISTLILYLVRVQRASFSRWLVFTALVSSIIVLVAVTFGPGLIRKVQYIQTLSGIELLTYMAASPFNTLLWRLMTSQAGLDLRITVWLPSWLEFLQSPVLGWGPGKDVQTAIVDNQYILYLRRYGVVGLLVYLLLFWNVLRVGLKLIRKFPVQSQEVSLGIALVSVNLAYLVVNLFMNTYYNLQVMSVFWLMSGVSYSLLYFSKSPGRFSSLASMETPI